MRAIRTRSGILVPEAMADWGRHPAFPKAEWDSLSERNQRYFADIMDRGGVGGGAIPGSYMIVNGAAPTTAAPVAVTTGTAIKTMLQVKPAVRLRMIEWGCSFDGSAAATPGKIELIETDVTAAAITAYAAADVMPFADLNAPANTAGTSGTPLNLGTTHSGFTSSSTEGSITATREFDVQFIAPTNQYLKQQPLDREPHLTVAKFIRWRNTFGAAVNAYYYIIFEPVSV